MSVSRFDAEFAAHIGGAAVVATLTHCGDQVAAEIFHNQDRGDLSPATISAALRALADSADGGAGGGDQNHDMGWPTGVPKAWLLPTGVGELMPVACLAIEGNPGTFVAESQGGWGSFAMSELPSNAQQLIPNDAAR